jgi:cyclopropane-fatty-acyl-phospholipid synthase
LTDSLEQAQQQKIDYLLHKLQLKRDQRVLDIGCGWGRLAVTAAKKYGVKVVGITLSQEQLKGARKLAKEAGISNLVTFKLANYQDLASKQKFDRIISVGMFEHVGRGNHASYFAKVRELLADDGLSVLHCITEMHDKKVSPWIDKYIFPGGYLPTVDNIEYLMAQYGFWSIDRENLWQHYALTLDEWRKRHRAHKAEIINMFDETFYRMQDFWLAGSAATFRYGETGLSQFIFTKQKPPFKTWPLTRQYLYR